MIELFLAFSSALWLGILTSISPCPLASNIAAISYVSRKLASPRRVFLSGSLYTLGRMLAYVIIGFILVYSLSSAWKVSSLLQKYMNMALGPLLIVVGILLLDWISINLFRGMDGMKWQKKVDSLGEGGAVVLGVIFALSFCPVSAALFFGSLIPLALKHQSAILVPTIYGIGTALPVIVFSVCIAMGASWVASAYNKMTSFEVWGRRITGVVFILIGIYLTLSQYFEIHLF